MAIPRPRPDGRVQLTLRDGSVLVGKLADDESIALQSVVGKVDVPMNEIMSVHFGDDGKSQVVFRNGDTLTGKLQLTEVRLTTSWAEVRIPTKELVKLFSSTYIASLGNGYRQVIERTPEGAQVRFEAIVPPTASYPSDPYGAPVPSAGPYSVPQSGYSAPAAPAAPLRPSPPPVIYGTHPG